MKTSDHLIIAGALQLVQGISSLLFGGAGVYMTLFDILAPERRGWNEIFELGPTVMLATVLLAGIVQTWFGIALIKQKQWVKRVKGFLCCIPSLIVFPPVVVGAYTIWVLVQANKAKERP